jgi:hypothetical protein
MEPAIHNANGHPEFYAQDREEEEANLEDTYKKECL